MKNLIACDYKLWTRIQELNWKNSEFLQYYLSKNTLNNLSFSVLNADLSFDTLTSRLRHIKLRTSAHMTLLLSEFANNPRRRKSTLKL